MSGRLPEIYIPDIIFDLPKEEGGKEYFIQEKRATSYEYNVALALEKVGLTFVFQLSSMGGRNFRGGIVLDFLVETRPLPTPLWVHGEYWHMGKRRTIDLMQQATLFMFMAGEWAMGRVLWGEDVATPEAALLAVKKEFLL